MRNISLCLAKFGNETNALAPERNFGKGGPREREGLGFLFLHAPVSVGKGLQNGTISDISVLGGGVLLSLVPPVRSGRVPANSVWQRSLSVQWHFVNRQGG